MKIRTALVVALLCLSCVPIVVFAHQPRIVGAGVTIVENPEISKAYYGRLTGEPHVFEMSPMEPFKFYMNVLVPDVTGAKKDVSVALVNIDTPAVPIAVLDGAGGTWTSYFEPFGRDAYYKGPEFTSMLAPGRYRVVVWSSNNDSAYALALGDVESYTPIDFLDAYQTMPRIKRDFFGKPAYTALLTPFLGGPIVSVIVVLGGGLYWYSRRRFR